MSFHARDLSVLAYANGFTLWHYRAGERALAVITRPGYFNDAIDMVAGGDMMLVSTADGGRVLCIAAGQGDVTVAAMA